ncbi:MAG: AAA family ATPase [Thermoplasmata archaeon]|nr:AAA family ATPase [Thermoplasmata archaeon]
MGTSRRPGRAGTPIALTGTPGTGKTTVAKKLAARHPVLEVAELALRTGAGRRRGKRDVEVDLPRLARYVARPGRLAAGTILVGHLAHLVPLRDAIVLRCRPDVLARRLRRARRGTSRDRRENFLAEALDVILLEALGAGRRVWEVDTTGRSPAAVASEVESLIARRPPSRFGKVRWLADRRVSAHLLDPPG